MKRSIFGSRFFSPVHGRLISLTLIARVLSSANISSIYTAGRNQPKQCKQQCHDDMRNQPLSAIHNPPSMPIMTK